MKKFFEEPQIEVIKLVSAEAIAIEEGDGLMSVDPDWPN